MVNIHNRQSYPPTPLIPAFKRREDRYQSDRKGQIERRHNKRTYDFLDIPFDVLTPSQTLARASWMSVRHEFRYIVTPNVDHLNRIWSDKEFFTPLYEGAWVSVCDSRILELLARASNIPLHAVPGSDLTAQIFDQLLQKEEPITIVGADNDIITTLKTRYSLTNINHYQPPMGLRHKPDEIAKCADYIAQNPSRFIFICVGSPQQEMIAKACIERGDCVGLGLCVGASLEFITGRVSRAPLWMQKARLEWLFRLISEPRRMWKRYLLEGPKIFLIWARWMQTRHKP